MEEQSEKRSRNGWRKIKSGKKTSIRAVRGRGGSEVVEEWRRGVRRMREVVLLLILSPILASR